MATYEDYKAGKAADLFLDFYATPGAETKETVLYRRVVDQDAYDTWHLSWYFKELLDLHALIQSPAPTLADIPRKEKNLLVYLLIEAWGADKDIDLAEFGCSLFEMIDGLELSQKVVNPKRDLLRRVRFHGIDLSDVMRAAAARLHLDRPIKFYRTAADIDTPFDILYERNVSSYAFSACADLANLMNKASVSFCNLFVSRNETFMSMRMGKTITYFGLDELISKLDRPLFHLFGKSSRGTSTADFDATQGRDVVEGFFLCADESYAKHWMDVARARPDVKAWFDEKDIRLTPARDLL